MPMPHFCGCAPGLFALLTASPPYNETLLRKASEITAHVADFELHFEGLRSFEHP